MLQNKVQIVVLFINENKITYLRFLYTPACLGHVCRLPLAALAQGWGGGVRALHYFYLHGLLVFKNEKASVPTSVHSAGVTWRGRQGGPRKPSISAERFS